MGSFANTVFSMLLGWVRSAVAGLWALMSSEGSSVFAWLGEHWLGLTVALCALCTLVDAVVYIIRWRPYKVWASFFRRLRGKGEEPVPAPSHSQAPVQRMRREWVYPDGNTRTEEIYAAPEQPTETEPPWLAEPAPALAERYDAVPVTDDSYLRRFARPETDGEADAVSPAPALEHLRFQPERTLPVTGSTGLEDYPPPREAQPMEEPAPEPISRQTQDQPEESLSRSRRMLRRVAALPKNFLIDDGEDELQLRYQPAQPAVDKKQAYHEPVYPPTWRPPSEAGTAHGEEQA